MSSRIYEFNNRNVKLLPPYHANFVVKAVGLRGLSTVVVIKMVMTGVGAGVVGWAEGTQSLLPPSGGDM